MSGTTEQRIAKVVVELALDRQFDYSIPSELIGSVQVGCKVSVPFGRSIRSAYVVCLASGSERKDLKGILSVESREPLISPLVLELAAWISRYYLAPIEHAVRAVLPGAVRRSSDNPAERLFVTVTEAGAKNGVVNILRERSPKQAAVLELVLGQEGLPMADVTRSLRTTSATVRLLEKKGLVEVEQKAIQRDPCAGRTIVKTEPLDLMAEQQVALDMVITAINAPAPPVVLLHGVTGSGKTEVYLQAIQHVLASGKGAIVLVPEISLTPQTVERFHSRFGDRIAVLHSHLSDGERHDEWCRLRDGKAQIAIGARSAVFAPVRNPGIIVVDEEHDTSYKQGESPRYNARDVAVVRGKLQACAVVLGSATPSLESFANAQSGKYRIAVLNHRADHRKMPVMRIVDMRVEAAKEGRAHVMSADLLEAVRLRLERAEQTILFLNRRGYATSLVCPKCGYVAKCGMCSVAFTYHRHTEELRCHICGGSKRVPTKCPQCSDPAFRFSGIGTQRVETIVKRFFPSASIQRMDSDATSSRGSHGRILNDFRTGKIDILVGTQMIAKGLDFPNVTLIGIVNADTGLHMPDFRAGERTFQLITQVAGRAGRGEIPGEVIVQTYTPHHFAVQSARNLDYIGFFDKESEFRRELRYPPFAHLACVTIRGRSDSATCFTAKQFYEKLRDSLPKEVIVAGPAPAPITRAKGYYRYQIMLRSKSALTVANGLRKAQQDFMWPSGVTCAMDVDAISLL